ncbi:hypothetical protein [Yoonia sp. 208BN28-4]|uniref:hypothetical protein n=1 Tax=Yoonia sp. 208BN28-4 TaxID=3126505 RepID=UPI0030A6CB09
MIYSDVSHFLRDGKAALAKGPVALILLEDDVEVASTIAHQVGCGFASVIVIGAEDIVGSGDDSPIVHRVAHDMMVDNALTDVVNPIIAAASGRWFYYGYNAEYLYYPFCEHRSVGEMVAFNMEERRDTIMTFVVDLYADDLSAAPNAVSRDDAHLDKSGYYALARHEKEQGYLERQLDFYGGLRWRFEEHVPYERRRIDRVGLFRAKPGLKLRPDHTFNDAEYNTYACPWHNNLTANICSFRTAKALKRNPGSAREIGSFTWRNSEKFAWGSQQLLDLGLMETGQWF